jgi:hypothetical protein
VHPQKLLMLGIHVAGGVAVLGSYAWGLGSHPELRSEVWGGVPEALKPLYTVSMWTAAAGYFAFSGFFLLAVDPDTAQIAGRPRFPLLNALYALVLVPSALWMPLTFAMLESPGPGLWLAIRVVLAVVGVGSLGLLAALLALRPREPALGYVLAIAGLAAFSFQTAILDALVWPAFFPV